MNDPNNAWEQITMKRARVQRLNHTAYPHQYAKRCSQVPQVLQAEGAININ